jgi:hypothetical protein
MTPVMVDQLEDEVWAAMVRLMVREADQIRAANAKLTRPGR